MKRWAFVLAALLAPSMASGQSTQGRTTILRWKVMDICAKQAQTAYPDYTAESNVKRDAALKNCLNANGLPPREPLSQPEKR